jgi:hypothetical protein
MYCFVNFFSDTNCTTATSGYPPPQIETGDLTRSWQSAFLSIDSGTGSINASCFFPGAWNTTVYLDQFYLNNSGAF